MTRTTGREPTARNADSLTEMIRKRHGAAAGVPEREKQKVLDVIIARKAEVVQPSP